LDVDLGTDNSGRWQARKTEVPRYSKIRFSLHHRRRDAGGASEPPIGNRAALIALPALGCFGDLK
jgi:hypothetical protein